MIVELFFRLEFYFCEVCLLLSISYVCSQGYGPASYYAVFDGHNGIDAAIYSVSHLHQYLAENPHYPKNPLLALKEACQSTDELFTLKADREVSCWFL